MTVTATGQLDPSQSDTIQTMNLYVDQVGNGVIVAGPPNCTGSKTCTTSYRVSTIRWTRHGTPDTITCKIPALPSGVRTTLAYGSGKNTVTMHGHSTSGKSASP